MNARETGSTLGRNASTAVIVPIAGIVGGLILGFLRSKALGLTALDQLMCLIKWAVTGFFAGLGLVMVLAVQPRRGDVFSIRRLMILIAMIGVLTWFFARVFLGVIGPGGF